MSSSRNVDATSGALGGFSCGSTSVSVPSLDLHDECAAYLADMFCISETRNGGNEALVLSRNSDRKCSGIKALVLPNKVQQEALASTCQTHWRRKSW